MTKILVIEDEEILRKEVMRWLRLEDYEVIGAGDGLEGVELAFRENPELILCDIALPHRDGYEVMLDIRSNIKTQLTPFIYMTARAGHEDIRKGMSLGADDYITKPFTRLELLNAIEATLNKKALQVEHYELELEQWREALKEEQEQRIFKAKLIGMFSHEFRNPLASILSSNGILQNHLERMDGEQRETHFRRINNSAHRLLQMLEEMLLVAQLDAGSLNYKAEPLDIFQLVHEIVEEFQGMVGNEHSIHFKADFVEIILGDGRLLRQILSNLISNALKYSPGGTEVSVALFADEYKLFLRVADNGIGIPEAELSKLFTAFHRASNVGKITGTGLGLAIVKQAVDLHGGTIEVESRLGQGTCFTVALPLEFGK